MSVYPETASNKTIKFEIDSSDTGETNPSISGDILTVTNVGKVQISMTVDDGLGVGVPYVQKAEITINPPISKPFVDINGINTEQFIGFPVNDNATIDPNDISI